MKRRKPVAAAGVAAAMTIVVIWSVSALGATSAAATQPFTAWANMGEPAAPTDWSGRSNGQWDVIDEARDLDAASSGAVPEFAAGHGPDCSNADTGQIPSHPITQRSQQLFICRDHLMTTLDSDQYGYGAIYLTPPAMVDFSNGATIDFASSTFRTSQRDWWDLWLTPFGENFVVPLDAGFPDLNGPPRDSLHVKMDQFNGGTIFEAEALNDFQSADVSSDGGDLLEQYETPSVVNRARFELRITPAGGRFHVQFGLPDYKNANGTLGHWFVDGTVALPFTQAVFQLAQHSYTPTKDAGCGPTIEDQQRGFSCAANTWHWSDFSISNSVPFTIDTGTPGAAGDASTVSVTLSQPSPASGYLRFAARATGLQVSFDDGATWQPAQVRQQVGSGIPSPSVDPYHLGNYWMPIPAGVKAVEFRGQGGWWGSSWFVQDVAVWSTSAPAPQPQAAPSPTPSLAASSSPPTPSTVPTPEERRPAHHSSASRHRGVHIGPWWFGPWTIGPWTLG